ncbi:hypothetical protein ACHSBP_20780 [Pseudoalteromonas sp. XMcav1-K]|uniref:hypothetical protein n=1 Tax=Pseudoalteromonas sp. XMcav1-K TaxID=3374372 RepID=UPI003756ABF8
MKFLVLLSTLLACFAHANVQFNNQEIAFMKQFYVKQGEQLTLSQTQQRLETLYFHLALAKQKAPTLLDRVTSVGFSTNYHKKRYMISLLSNENTQVSVPNIALTSTKLKQLLGNYPHNGIATTQLLAKLTQPLTTSYTLADAYNDASMQARFNLHQGDIKQLTELVKVEAHYQTVKQQHQNPNIRWPVLESLSTSQAITPALLNYLGVKASMHNESPYLDSLKQQISTPEIAKYYQQNKQQFRYSSEVTAASLIFNSQEAAQAAYKNNALSQQLNSKKAVIKRKTLNNNFVNQAAFNLSTKQGPTLLRTPKEQWVIIQVFDKKYDYYPENSETVVYQAKTSLATTLAKKQYATAKNQWLKGDQL